MWDIVSQTKKKDAYSLMLAGGLTIKVDKLKKGKRNITIGNGKPASCSPITKATLPDYPTKDLRTSFVDNGYKANDSVTIIGWLKDMPERAWKQSSEFEVSIDNIFTDDQQKFYAKMDSLGRFSLRMPLANTSQAYLDLRRTSAGTILEPGKTYFFLNDFTTGQRLFMGDDTRADGQHLQRDDNRTGGAHQPAPQPVAALYRLYQGLLPDRTG